MTRKLIARTLAGLKTASWSVGCHHPPCNETILLTVTIEDPTGYEPTEKQQQAQAEDHIKKAGWGIVHHDVIRAEPEPPQVERYPQYYCPAHLHQYRQQREA